MALFDDVFGKWTTGGIAAVGIGAIFLVPAVGALVGTVVRPIAKTVLRAGFLVTDAVTGIVTEASSQVSDLIAEARDATTNGRPSSML